MSESFIPCDECGFKLPSSISLPKVDGRTVCAPCERMLTGSGADRNGLMTPWFRA